MDAQNKVRTKNNYWGGEKGNPSPCRNDLLTPKNRKFLVEDIDCKITSPHLFSSRLLLFLICTNKPFIRKRRRDYFAGVFINIRFELFQTRGEAFSQGLGPHAAWWLSEILRGAYHILYEHGYTNIKIIAIKATPPPLCSCLLSSPMGISSTRQLPASSHKTADTYICMRTRAVRNASPYPTALTNRAHCHLCLTRSERLRQAVVQTAAVE